MEHQHSAQNTTLLRQVFTNIQADSCPRHYNFHMHTNCSDGKLTPEALMTQAVEIGLQGMAITDHHCLDGYYRAAKWLELRSSERSSSLANTAPHLWTGIEITAYLPPVDVHILGYGFDPLEPSLAPYLTGREPRGVDARAERVIAALHQAGAIVVLAHPSRYRRSPEELIPTAVSLGIDGVETYYAYNNPSPWISSFEQTETVKRLGNSYNLLHTCGTDTHGLNLLQRL
ncbi:PHP domain-containing protein [Chamaesiphon sp.]|uniref:PHP domain-containing protein n=1 Tax=Chamaesiphon sp. TaxID=2814140 RepID=UPI0035940B93